MVNENDDTAPQSPPSDDWLLPGSPQEQYAEEPPPQRRSGLPGRLKPVGLVVAGLLVGGAVVVVAQAVAGEDSSTRSVASSGSFGTDSRGGTHDRGFGGEGAAPPGGAPGFQPGGPGALVGEQHLSGTLTAVGNDTVTVTTPSGAATYQVTDTTEVVRNGAAAQLSALKVGDPVLVHVYPASSDGGRMVVERIFAGTLPSTPGAPDGDVAGRDSAGQGGAGQNGADQDGAATDPTTT